MKAENINHREAAATFIKDRKREKWHDKAIWWVRNNRDKEAHSLPEWEQLREAAKAIKNHTLAHLADYLEQFETNAKRNGIHVHWAADALEHNQIVLAILKSKQAKNLIKSKSMLTEECGMAPFLEAKGIELIESDLGERIIQLRHDAPSHVVLPAIHVKKEEISQLFHEKMGTEAGNNDPTYLTHAARKNLRHHFIEADATLSGVNFGIAETGGFVVCTNEGNADLGMSLAPVHIASMGIEKLIPKLEHLAIFTRLLTRSAVGGAITSYTTHIHKPRPDGELHLILVDNGRSDILASPEFYQSLRCIRCGACMNTCPVYRRSGGLSYSYVIPGPIGSTLGACRDIKKHVGNIFACTTCGSCSNVCPVKINLDEQLIWHRKKAFEQHLMPFGKRPSLGLMKVSMQSAPLFQIEGKLARTFAPLTPKTILRMTPWSKMGRDIPVFPAQSFKEWMKAQKKKGKA